MNKLEDREFYVYEHWRPDKGLPFYVGKGIGGRASALKSRPRYHQRVQAKLSRLGLSVEIRKVFTHLDEHTAFALERSQISYWRTHSVVLVNNSDGGEGSSGYRLTPAQRRRHRIVMKAIGQDPVVCAKKSISGKVAQNRPEVRARNSAIQTARQSRPEVKAKARALGKIVQNRPEVKAWQRKIQKVAQNRPGVNERRGAAIKASFDVLDRREKCRARQKAQWANPEFRAKVSAAISRALSTPEACAANSTRFKLLWQNPEFREKQAKASKAANAKPELRKKRSIAAVEVNSRPGMREKKRALALISQNRPDVKERIRVGVKAYWAAKRASETIKSGESL